MDVSNCRIFSESSFHQRLIKLTLSLVFAFSSAVSYSSASDTGTSVTAQIFDVDYYQLDNQIPVITRKRHNNDLFSIQLVANVGLRDFPCADRHLPHVVEHLLFEGTKTYSAKELRERVFDKGGYWQGYTVEEYTHYTINIHKKFADIAVDTLYRMLNEPAFSAKGHGNALRAVNTERGTATGGLQNWINDTLSVAELGKNRLYPGTNLACEKRQTPNHLTLEQAKALFDAYYVPENFTLLVVGRFDDQSLKQQLNQTFGQLPPTPAPTRQPLAENPIDYTPIEETEKYGDPTAYFKMYVRADGKTEPTHAAWQLISIYLTERLFEEIRTERGIGYSPRARYIAGPTLGHLAMNVRTTSEWLDQVETISLQIYDELKTSGIPQADIERIKHRMTYIFEAKERKNQHLFQLYRHHIDWIKKHGTMKNLLADIEKLDSESIQAVIQKMPPKPVVAVLRPNSFVEAILKVIAIVAIAALLALPIYKRSKRRQQQAKP